MKGRPQPTFLTAYTHANLSDAGVKVNIPDPSGLIGVMLGGSPGSSPFSNNPTSLLVKLPDSLDGWSLGGDARTPARDNVAEFFQHECGSVEIDLEDHFRRRLRR